MSLRVSHACTTMPVTAIYAKKQNATATAKPKAIDRVPAPVEFLAPAEEIVELDPVADADAEPVADAETVVGFVPLDPAVSVGTVDMVMVSVVRLSAALAVSFTLSAVALTLASIGSLTVVEADPVAATAAVSGYICASSTITSAGRSLYHCGIALPVGSTISVPEAVGMAVLRTERTDSLVGSMVAGSMARTSRSATACDGGEARALATSAVVERIVVDFMFAM